MPTLAFRILLIYALIGAIQGLTAAERLALLPFADPGSHDDARGFVNMSARSVLSKRGFELVSEDSVMHILRELRIRNTATPNSNELRDLADSLDADFVLVGTIHQFTTEDEFTEVTLSARLIRAADAKMVWTNWTTVSGGGEAALFSKPVFDNAPRAARVTTKKLLKSVRTTFEANRKIVTDLRTPNGRTGITVSCATLAVIPPTNESNEEHAGELVGDLLVSELTRRGFTIVDPGAVRSIMLLCDDLRHGQSVETVSQLLVDSLGVDIVLTGSISGLTDIRSAIIGTIPEVSMELRMIDARSSTLVWARTFSRQGNQCALPFKFGVTHSPALLAQQLVRDAVSDVPVVRRRNTSQPN